MAETLRTIDGEIDEIRERISSTGDNVVEIHLSVATGKEKAFAYAEKAKVLANLAEKMKGMAARNSCAHIRELHVRVELSGIVKNQSATGDLIVTGIKIVQ